MKICLIYLKSDISMFYWYKHWNTWPESFLLILHEFISSFDKVDIMASINIYFTNIDQLIHTRKIYIFRPNYLSELAFWTTGKKVPTTWEQIICGNLRDKMWTHGFEDDLVECWIGGGGYYDAPLPGSWAHEEHKVVRALFSSSKSALFEFWSEFMEKKI